MSKVSNVITMLELLQTGKKYSINELSNKHGFVDAYKLRKIRETGTF